MMWFLRFYIGATAGGAGGCLAAANWPNQHDVVAGTILGIGGTLVGAVLGGLWAEWAERDS